MSFDQKPGTGALFKNETDNPKAPGYKGNFKTLDGVEFKIAAWVREKKDGTKYFSIVQDKPRDEAPKRSKPASDFDDDLSSVPF